MAARKATLVLTAPRQQSGACAVSGKKTGAGELPGFIPGGSDDLRWATRKKTGRESRPGLIPGESDPLRWATRERLPGREARQSPGRQPPAALTAPVGHAPPLAKARSSDELSVVAADGHRAARRGI